MTKPSNVVDINDPEANMYGCQPCPKCKSIYRAVFKGGIIKCDECGFEEKALYAENL